MVRDTLQVASECRSESASTVVNGLAMPDAASGVRHSAFPDGLLPLVDQERSQRLVGRELGPDEKVVGAFVERKHCPLE